MNDEQIKNLQKQYEENKKLFNELIQAQDCVRAVYCREDKPENSLRLRHIDKLLTKEINYYGNKVGSVSNAS